MATILTPESQALCRVVWRAGFGAAPAESVDSDTTISASIEALVRPDAAGVASAPDPWLDDLGARRDVDISMPELRQLTGGAALAWLDAMATSPRPFTEWMAWFWHGHFVVSAQKVRDPFLLMDYGRLLRTHALGNFRDFLIDMTINGAMLAYLDGVTSRAGSPNENYARELFELFSLGIGNYTEDDIAGAAAALTGWRVNPRQGRYTARLVPQRHDSSPQQVLGHTVNDVEGVVDAVLAQDACADFITAELALAMLGRDAVLANAGPLIDVAQRFRSSGYEISVLAEDLFGLAVEPAAADAAGEVLAPVPWMVSLARRIGSSAAAPLSGLLPQRQLAGFVEATGQVPLVPPNVAGWPGSSSWLSASNYVGRFNLATVLAERTTNPVLASSAAAADAQAMADELGLERPLGTGTIAAIEAIGPGSPIEALTTIYLAPEVLVP